jgi:HlyD family secretion protein
MKKGFSIILSSLLAASCLTGCGGGKSEMASGDMASQNTVAITVNTQEITPLTIEQSTIVSSKITAENEVSVFPNSGGTVKAVYVSLGDTVKAGDVLFEIDSTDAQLQLQQAQASLSSAEAGLQSAQANYDSTVGGTLENELQQLQSTVDSYQIQYDNAVTSLEQTKELYEIGGASKQEVDDLQSTVDQLKLQLDTAKKQLELNENQILEETKKSSEANVKQSEANVAQSQVSVESAQKTLEDTKVRAEIDGVVSSINITEGSMASAQSAAMTISSLDTVKVSFNVSEDVINRISVGSKAYITVSAVSDTPYETTLSGVSPSADSQTKLYTAEAYIDNSDGQLKPGMFATVKLVLDTKENTVSVPLNTVIEKNDEKYVFVVDENNIAHKTLVETGLKNDESIEITSGVNMGDLVVISGQDFLSDGSTVNIVEAVE